MSVLSSTKPDAWTLSPQMTAAPELWRGVVFAAAFWEGAGTPFDLVSGEFATVDNANGIWDLGAKGRYLTTDGGNRKVEFSARSWDFANDEISVGALWGPDVLGTDQNTIASAFRPDQTWLFRSETDGSLQFFTDSGANTQIAQTAANVVQAGGEYGVLGLTRGKNTKAEMYRDGEKLTNSQLDQDMEQMNTTPSPLHFLSWGPNGAFNDVQASRLGLCVIWDYALSESRAKQFTLDPLAMLRPAGF